MLIKSSLVEKGGLDKRLYQGTRIYVIIGLLIVAAKSQNKKIHKWQQGCGRT